ncbi:MAG: TIGR00266 family protein [Candidatus Bathyarchaeota archaeon]|nr:MAG: TIGR00266 family protein [Candidatus Bathyarchaeota archaeon]
MKYDIKYEPSYAMLVVDLEAGEKIVGEAGAMTYMTSNIDVETRRRERSILGTIGLKILAGQSLFVNDYVARGGSGQVALGAAPVGDIQTLKVEPERGFIIQKAAYLANTENVELDVKWEGFTKGLFGQGVFMIRVYGSGDLFINTFGAIDEHELGPGEEMVVDNFHLVAFSDSCDYKVEKFGGWKETILSGEGFITRIRGPGEVYLQTKNLREFVDWLWTLISPRVRSRSR